MHRTRLLVAAVCAVGVPASAQAQGREVAGKVTEAVTGQPVRDAAVGIVGQQTAACTNQRGEYRLRVSAGDGYLVVGAPGSIPRVISLGPADTAADFRLEKQGQHRPGEIVALTTSFATDVVGGSRSSGEPLFVVDGVTLSEPVLHCRGGQLIRIGPGAN